MAGFMERLLGRDTGEMHTLEACECTHSGLQLKEDLRKIWDDHVFWTREVILTAATSDPAGPLVGQAVARLMKNQEDIGGAVALFYGEAAGMELTRLLKDHIQYAIDLVVAAKAGDSDKQGVANDAWYANAKDISKFLSDANPTYWPYDAVLDMMNKHLDLTTVEAVDLLQGNYEKAIADFEAVREEIIMMSDSIAEGIMMQFPERFRAQASRAA